MTLWVRNTIFTLLAFGIGYGLWLYFGGDLTGFLKVIGDLFGGIVSTLGHAVAGILNGLFGHAPSKG